jgi:hypothetical protein
MISLRFSTLILFAISGLISAAAAGFLLTILILGAAGGPIGLVLGLFLGFMGAGPAVKMAGIPAIMLGGTLWTAGATRSWARNLTLWAGTGALTGLACYAAAVFIRLQDIRDAIELARLGPFGLATMFVIAGAGAALMFRGTMRVLLLFAPGETKP